MKLFALLLAAVMSAGMVHAAENLVKNGDFAMNGNEWKSPQYTGGRKFHTFIRNQLVVSGNSAAKYNSFVTLVQQLPQLDPAKEYLLRADFTINIPERAKKHFRLAIRHASQDNKTLLYSDLNPDFNSTGKQTRTIKFRPHASGAKFYVYVISINLADSDIVTVDNISVTEVPDSSGSSGNLVQNGNFESRSLAPWKTPTGKARNTPFALVTDPETANGVLTVNGDEQNKYNNFLTLIQTLPQLNSGKKYLLKAKFKAGLTDTAKKAVAVSVRESDYDNITVVYDAVNADLSNSEWKEYSLVFIPRVEADKFQLYIHSSRLADGDRVLVDDISVTPVK